MHILSQFCAKKKARSGEWVGVNSFERAGDVWVLCHEFGWAGSRTDGWGGLYGAGNVRGHTKVGGFCHERLVGKGRVSWWLWFCPKEEMVGSTGSRPKGRVGRVSDGRSGGLYVAGTGRWRRSVGSGRKDRAGQGRRGLGRKVGREGPRLQSRVGWRLGSRSDIWKGPQFFKCAFPKTRTACIYYRFSF